MHVSVICIICRVEIEPDQHISVTPCGHVFHSDCITTWFNSGRNEKCPTCRAHCRAFKGRKTMRLFLDFEEEESQVHNQQPQGLVTATGNGGGDNKGHTVEVVDLTQRQAPDPQNEQASGSNEGATVVKSEQTLRMEAEIGMLKVDKLNLLSELEAAGSETLNLRLELERTMENLTTKAMDLDNLRMEMDNLKLSTRSEIESKKKRYKAMEEKYNDTNARLDAATKLSEKLRKQIESTKFLQDFNPSEVSQIKQLKMGCSPDQLADMYVSNKKSFDRTKDELSKLHGSYDSLLAKYSKVTAKLEAIKDESEHKEKTIVKLEGRVKLMRDKLVNQSQNARPPESTGNGDAGSISKLVRKRSSNSETSRSSSDQAGGPSKIQRTLSNNTEVLSSSSETRNSSQQPSILEIIGRGAPTTGCTTDKNVEENNKENGLSIVSDSGKLVDSQTPLLRGPQNANRFGDTKIFKRMPTAQMQRPSLPKTMGGVMASKNQIAGKIGSMGKLGKIQQMRQNFRQPKKPSSSSTSRLFN